MTEVLFSKEKAAKWMEDELAKHGRDGVLERLVSEGGHSEEDAQKILAQAEAEIARLNADEEEFATFGQDEPLPLAALVTDDEYSVWVRLALPTKGGDIIHNLHIQPFVAEELMKDLQEAVLEFAIRHTAANCLQIMAKALNAGQGIAMALSQVANEYDVVLLGSDGPGEEEEGE